MFHFEEVITHQGHLQYLKSAVHHGTLPHALLLWGPEGSGALAAALAIAQYLVCTERTTDGPCGTCKGCTKSDKFMHPDIHFAFPTIGAKVTGDMLYPQWRKVIAENPHLNRHDWLDQIDAEGKQGNINVADCQRMINLLSLRSFEAECKVLVLWLPEYLGKDGNMLLKLIEEPPEDSYMLLVAENREDILPTILSRCQQLYFPPLSEEFIRTGLIHHLKIDAEKAGWIAASAQGDWNLALQIAEGRTFNPVQWAQDWIKAAWSRDPGMVAAWSESAAKYSREESKQLLMYILSLLQKVLWCKYGKDFQASESEQTTVSFLNKKIEHRELAALTMLCEENLRAIQQNASGRILWFHLTMALQKMLLAENAKVANA